MSILSVVIAWFQVPFVRSLCLLSLLSVLSACAFVDQIETKEQTVIDYNRAQHILVTFEQHDFSHVFASPGIDYHQRPFSQYQVPASVREHMDSVLGKHNLEFVAAWPMRLLGVLCAVVEVPNNLSVDQVLAELREDSGVESAQAMNWLVVNNSEAIAAVPELEQQGGADPYAKLQKSLLETGVFAAHQKSTGRGVRVAIVDTSVDTEHTDLQGKVSRQKNFTPYSGVGVHGTAVAGIIAAHEGNGEGMVGVAPDVELLSYSGCWPSPGEKRAMCNSFTLAQAISAAIEANVDILNLSLSGPRDPLLERLIRVALAKQVIVVAAIDAGKPRDKQFPAAMDDIVVAYVQSEQDSSRPFYAPSIDILATIPNNAYDFKSGSSMAAAHLSGIVALLKQYRSKMNQQQLMNLLQSSVNVVVDKSGKPEKLVNVCKALASLGESVDCRT